MPTNNNNNGEIERRISRKESDSIFLKRFESPSPKNPDEFEIKNNPNGSNNVTILPSYSRPTSRNGIFDPEANRPYKYFDEEDHFHDIASTLKSHNIIQNPENNTKKTSGVEEVIRTIGIDDVCGNSSLLKMVLAEFIGTLFIVLIGCGSCLSGWNQNYEPTIVQIALAFGVTVATMAQAIGHISGAMLNPAVTVGLLISGKCSILKSLFYILAQCLGGVCGSLILQAITPVEIQGNLGMTVLSDKIDPIQALFLEALITFVLVLTVSGVSDDLRQDVNKGSAPLAIGLSISACHLMAIKYTGSSMNPARSLGPALVLKNWNNHWVYWAGPMLGGSIAGLLYRIAFSEKITERKN